MVFELLIKFPDEDIPCCFHIVVDWVQVHQPGHYVSNPSVDLWALYQGEYYSNPSYGRLKSGYAFVGHDVEQEVV